MRFIRKTFGQLWHLIWACVPGCGQMCQGYMKRGISQTIIFSVIIFIAVFLEMGVLAVLVAPLWCYSFFDSYNLRRQLREGTAPEDEFMFGLSDMDSQRLTRILSRRGSLIGWILIVVGLYNIYRIFAQRFLGMLYNLFPWLDWLYGFLVWDAPRLLGTILIIALGLWFIRGPGIPKDDGPSYTPPKDPGSPPKMKATPWTKAEEAFHREPAPQAPEVPVVSEEAPKAPEQVPEEIPPVTLTWKSEFEVEKFEKQLQEEKREGGHDGQ